MADCATCTIYALSDPRKPELIRYIGKTHLGLNRRLKQHFQYAKRKVTPKNSWLISLQKQGLDCLIWPLETCPVQVWEERERFWIWLFRPLPSLLNLSDGGNTGPNMTGYRHSDETRHKISEAGKGRKPTAKNIEACRLRSIGRKWTEQQHQKFRLTKVGTHFSEKRLENHRRVMKEKLGGKKRPVEIFEKIRKTKMERGIWFGQAAHLARNNIRPVQCVETGEIFPAIADATRRFGLARTAIFQALKLNTRAGKYHWRYP